MMFQRIRLRPKMGRMKWSTAILCRALVNTGTGKFSTHFHKVFRRPCYSIIFKDHSILLHWDYYWSMRLTRNLFEYTMIYRSTSTFDEYSGENKCFFEFHSMVYIYFLYRQLGCLAFSLRFWSKIKQLLSNCPASDWTFFSKTAYFH